MRRWAEDRVTAAPERRRADTAAVWSVAARRRHRRRRDRRRHRSEGTPGAGRAAGCRAARGTRYELCGVNQYAIAQNGIGAFNLLWSDANRKRATCGTDSRYPVAPALIGSSATGVRWAARQEITLTTTRVTAAISAVVIPWRRGRRCRSASPGIAQGHGASRDGMAHARDHGRTAGGARGSQSNPPRPTCVSNLQTLRCRDANNTRNAVAHCTLLHATADERPFQDQRPAPIRLRSRFRRNRQDCTYTRVDHANAVAAIIASYARALVFRPAGEATLPPVQKRGPPARRLTSGWAVRAQPANLAALACWTIEAIGALAAIARRAVTR
jgi:hypothetical protein